MNKIANMFDIDKVMKQIEECPTDEVVILCPHWSINGPKYTDSEYENEAHTFDWEEFEQRIGYTLQVNDYDDLIIDVHGIMNF